MKITGLNDKTEEFYIRFTKNGVLGMTKKKPTLKKTERAVKFKFSYPLEIFDEHIPEREVEISKGEVYEPDIVEDEIQIEKGSPAEDLVEEIDKFN